MYTIKLWTWINTLTMPSSWNSTLRRIPDSCRVVHSTSNIYAELLLAFVVINLLIGKYSNPIIKLLFDGLFLTERAAQIAEWQSKKIALSKKSLPLVCGIFTFRTDRSDVIQSIHGNGVQGDCIVSISATYCKYTFSNDVISPQTISLQKNAMQKGYNTWGSHAVTHRSTNQAQRCLTSVIGREPVYSTWYGRSRFSISLPL